MMLSKIPLPLRRFSLGLRCVPLSARPVLQVRRLLSPFEESIGQVSYATASCGSALPFCAPVNHFRSESGHARPAHVQLQQLGHTKSIGWAGAAPSKRELRAGCFLMSIQGGGFSGFPAFRNIAMQAGIFGGAWLVSTARRERRSGEQSSLRRMFPAHRQMLLGLRCAGRGM
jgi:hypothetical protein